MAIRSRTLTEDTAYASYFKDLMLEKRTAIPGIIAKINKQGTALVSVDVQPAIGLKIASESGFESTNEALPIIGGVPVVLPYAQTAGFVLTIPISVGDDCLLIIADRSIDDWQFNGGVQAPVETTVPRSHDLTDAVCIVGLMNNTTTLDDYQFDSIELRNAARNVCIRLSDTDIKIVMDGVSTTYSSTAITSTIGSSSILMTNNSITLDAQTVTINGSNLVVESSNTTFEQNTFFQDDAIFEDDVVFNDSATFNDSIVDSNGVELESHFHEDSTGGDTGLPED